VDQQPAGSLRFEELQAMGGIGDGHFKQARRRYRT
jgi:hypothetical protein